MGSPKIREAPTSPSAAGRGVVTQALSIPHDGNVPLTLGDYHIRRDGDMWCLTDLWRAEGSPESKRPGNYIQGAGKSFIEFLNDSVDTQKSSIVKARKNAGSSPGGETWGHWQLALAYAKWISHELHARVNAVYKEFMSGAIVRRTYAEDELIRYTLRVQRLDSSEYESIWDTELKIELARLRGLTWDGQGVEPHRLAFAYGKTLRIILGDAVYESLKVRNPKPQAGTLHGQWLQDARVKVAKREDMVISLVLARRSSRWREYEAEMRSHFRRAPIQLRLVTNK